MFVKFEMKWGLVAGVSLACLATEASAQQRGGRAGGGQNPLTGKIQQEIANDKKEFDELQKKAVDIKRQFDQADADYKAKSKALTETRERVKKEHNQAPDLVEAREKADEARKAFAKAKAEIITKLMDQKEYQAALANRDKAKKALDNAKDDRIALAKASASAADEVRRIENDAIEADSKGKSAREESAGAEKNLAEKMKETKAAIEADDKLRTAESEAETSKEAFLTARNQLMEVAGALNRLGAELQAEMMLGAQLQMMGGRQGGGAQRGGQKYPQKR